MQWFLCGSCVAGCGSHASNLDASDPWLQRHSSWDTVSGFGCRRLRQRSVARGRLVLRSASRYGERTVEYRQQRGDRLLDYRCSPFEQQGSSSLRYTRTSTWAAIEPNDGAKK